MRHLLVQLTQKACKCTLLFHHRAFVKTQSSFEFFDFSPQEPGYIRTLLRVWGDVHEEYGKTTGVQMSKLGASAYED